MKDLSKTLTPYISFEFTVRNGDKKVGIKRCVLDNLNIYYPIFCIYNKLKNGYIWETLGNGRHDSQFAAVKHLDEILIRLGFIFLTEEEWGKYSLLT
jgi:hypothetical protein